MFRTFQQCTETDNASLYLDKASFLTPPRNAIVEFITILTNEHKIITFLNICMTEGEKTLLITAVIDFRSTERRSINCAGHRPKGAN